MIAAVQRWRARRDSYRPVGEPIDVRAYGVEAIDELPAKRFVTRHHYSATFPAARVRVGLFRLRELVGVAVFSVPMSQAVIPRRLGQRPEHGIELGRFVLLDDVPANGETWFLARAFRVLREEAPEVQAVVAHADPVPRFTSAGLVVTPGHVGTIYQAFNGRYVGKTTRRFLMLAPDATVISSRTLSKIRNSERGEAYAQRQLERSGCPRRALGESGEAWIARALDGLRRVPHDGCHAYAWALTRDAARRLPEAAGPFPKRTAA